MSVNLTVSKKKNKLLDNHFLCAKITVLLKAVKAHSSNLISIRERESSAGSSLKFSQDYEIHAGASFLKYTVGNDVNARYA